MGAMELLTGFVTAPSTTETALTMASGNSNVIRGVSPDSKVILLNTWAKVQAAGIWKIRSPRMHDNVQGIRFRTGTANVQPYLPYNTNQQLFAQDALNMTLSGSATAGDIEQASLLVYYESLPGSDARLFSWEELSPKVIDVMSTEVSITGGTAGGYSGAVSIVSSFDLLKANMDYAILGYFVNTIACSVRISGADLGNLGIGGPADPAIKHITSDWFIKLNWETGLPTVPVINSSNKNNTLIEIACDENGGTFIVNLILAELSRV